MPAFDTGGMTDQELHRFFAQTCTPHGSVLKVNVHVSRINSMSVPCVIVEMATAEAAERVADIFAATLIGKSVIIVLASNSLSAGLAMAKRALPEPRTKTPFESLVQDASRTRPGYVLCV